MKRIIPILLFAILIPAVTLSAQAVENTFLFFLSTIVERHEELKTLTMPGFEIHTVPDIDDEAVYDLTFSKTEDIECFINALEKENILYGTFPNAELRLILFYSDLLPFLMKAAIGL